jgi:hypothetical protein
MRKSKGHPIGDTLNSPHIFDAKEHLLKIENI